MERKVLLPFEVVNMRKSNHDFSIEKLLLKCNEGSHHQPGINNQEGSNCSGRGIIMKRCEREKSSSIPSSFSSTSNVPFSTQIMTISSLQKVNEEGEGEEGAASIKEKKKSSSGKILFIFLLSLFGKKE